jgi:tetratricopeptide (TPR) repeat protein
LLFVGTLIPALGFFNIYPMRYSFVADHFQYHACVALCVLSAIGLQRLLRRYAYSPLAILLIITMSRSYALADPLRLWQDTAAKNPNSWMVHLNLARTLDQYKRPEEAQAEFELQLALGPRLPETHWNWGVNLARRDKLEEALAEYDVAIELDPSFAPAYYSRGRVLVQQHKPDQAAVQFQRAIELDRGPEQRTYRAAAHAELAELFKQQRLFDQAITHYRAAIDDDPMFAKARVNLAALLAAKGEVDEATKQFDQAVQIDPSLETYRAAALTPPPIR